MPWGSQGEAVPECTCGSGPTVPASPRQYYLPCHVLAASTDPGTTASTGQTLACPYLRSIPAGRCCHCACSTNRELRLYKLSTESKTAQPETSRAPVLSSQLWPVALTSGCHLAFLGTSRSSPSWALYEGRYEEVLRVPISLELQVTQCYWVKAIF